MQLGIDDPERWLATRPKRVVHLWEAYWRLEPWGLPWHRNAAWLSKLDQVLEVVLMWASFGKTKYKAKSFRHWMPADWVDSAEPEKKKISLKQQMDLVAKAFGGFNK